MARLSPDPQPSARRVLLADRKLRAYTASRFLTAFSMEALHVAVGWQIYDITRDPLALGLVGLIQFLPTFLLVLVTGAAADRFPRRWIMAAALGVFALCAAALVGLTLSGNQRVAPIYAVLTAVGVARAFYQPATRSLINNLVSREQLALAITMNTTGERIGTISGAVVGGLLYGLAAESAYLLAAVTYLCALALIATIPKSPRSPGMSGSRWEMLSAGARYVLTHRLLLGAITLDLFAVLLSGASALLPVFARDILEAGPFELGLLRCGPAIGGIAVALCLAWRPIARNAGAIMFLCVAGFGVATAGFGISRSVWLSVLFLAAAGGFDMVSVLIRETLVQLATPDMMRGRVNAINAVFVSASNHIGDFRAGLMAAWLGAVPAVLVGGIGAIIVAGLWWRWFPELRNARRIDGRDE